jgi:DNA invertase Pin-like site-specific DNA recombinase
MELSGLIYARISQVFGETDDSLDNQVGQSSTAASAIGVPINHTFRERDSGHETADTRKELLRARELVRAGRITHFFIHNFDRLSRTPEELVGLWKECQRHKVKVVVAMWPQFHDMDLEMAKMMLRMIGMVGEFEWSFIRARTTQNKARIRDKGMVVGEGGPRFGFTWDRENRSRKPSEEKHPTFGVSSAQIVRTIYEMIGNQGYSLRTTARALNELGWPTPAVFRGKRYKDGRRPRWTNDSVRLVVVDEQYKGVVTCSRTEMVGKRRTRKKPRVDWQVLTDARTTPVVSEALWEAANRHIRDNDIIGGRTRAKNAAQTRNETNFALFRGIILCAACGSPLRPVWVKAWNKEAKDYSAPKVRVYRCDSRTDDYERGLPKGCYGKAVYEWKVKDAVWEQVVRVVTDEDLITAEAERLKRERPGESLHRASHESALSEVESCDRRVRNLVASLGDANDAEDRAIIREAVENAKKAREGHRRHADRLAEQLSVYDALDREAELLVERCRQLRASNQDLLQMPDEEKRYWLEGLKVSIVGNGVDLTVRFDMGLAEEVQHPRATCRMTSRMLKSPSETEVVYLQYHVASSAAADSVSPAHPTRRLS